MRYTIHGFDQAEMIKSGMDLIDAMLLRYFVDYHDTNLMATVKNEEGKTFHWLSYNDVLKAIPIIGITSKDVIARRFSKLVEQNYLENYTHRGVIKVGNELIKGTFSTYKIGKKYTNLIDSRREGDDSKVGGGSDSKVGTKILPIIKNSSIIKKESMKSKKEIYSDEKNVLLTTEEFTKLETKLGKERTQEKIESLSLYLLNHPGKRYASHYATIITWARKDQEKNVPPKKEGTVYRMKCPDCGKLRPLTHTISFCPDCKTDYEKVVQSD